MSTQTREAFYAAWREHDAAAAAAGQAAADEASAGGGDRDAAAAAAAAAHDRSEVEAAALAHVAAYDPTYQNRTGGLPLHERIVAPDLKARYDEALEAWNANPGDADAAAAVDELGQEYHDVRSAAAVADGLPLTTTV